MERAARETGSFSFNSAWLAEVDGAVAACLLGYPAEDEPSPISPDTPPVCVPLLELEALAPGSWYLNVLATYDSFRGKGCGSALLATAEEITVGVPVAVPEPSTLAAAGMGALALGIAYRRRRRAARGRAVAESET
jgi:GNAT superfamily N-acetyltransferase